MDVTVRSNLIAREQYVSLFPRFASADVVHLKPIAESFGKVSQVGIAQNGSDLETNPVYYVQYEARKDSARLMLSNRVIGYDKKEDVDAENRRLAKFLFPKSIKSLDFAIAPKGVMLMHSSQAVNNPILWMSHADFRRTFSCRPIRSSHDFLVLARLVVVQNDAMYKVLRKDGMEFGRMMDLFETHRIQLMKYKKPRI